MVSEAAPISRLSTGGRDASHDDALTSRVWGNGKDDIVRTTDGSHVRGSRTMTHAYARQLLK